MTQTEPTSTSTHLYAKISGALLTFMVAGFCAASLFGCSITVGAQSPRPTTVVPAGSYALSLGEGVQDSYALPQATVAEFRTTLANAFYNMMGAQATADASQQPLTLQIDQCHLSIESAGVTGYLTAQVVGRWLAPDGREVGRFAGRVDAPNPLSDGPAQVTRLVETIFEGIIRGLNEETQGGTNEQQLGGTNNTTGFQ